MVLIVLGIVAMMQNKETNTTKVLMKIGMVMMAVSYLTVVSWAIFSLMGSQQEPSSPAFEEGSQVSSYINLQTRMKIS
jgi:hypothetical protein